MSDGDTYLIPVTPDNPYPLGRAGVHHDPRNRSFRALMNPPPQSTNPGKVWFRDGDEIFDQRQQSSCTMQATVGVARTYPFRRRSKLLWSNADTFAKREELHERSKDYDPWPGRDYLGTSSDAPLRLLREMSLIDGWQWLFGEDELWYFVTNHGPAQVGTIWRYQMFFPDAEGYIHPEGAEAGGHEYALAQANQRRQAYRVINSWGRGWGRSGRAWITRASMAALLAADGDASTLTWVV